MRMNENRSLFNELNRARAITATLLAAALAVSGCAYRGGLDEPIARKLSWFSYLSGDDIRTSCGPGSLDRYRLVYNADYEKQVRTYDATADGSGGAWLAVRVSRPFDFSRLSFSDIEGPWRWQRADAAAAPAAFEDLRRRLSESGFAAGAPVGLTLYSVGFWWTAAGCEDGQFHFTAWAHPDAGFAQLQFPELLFALDQTGIPVNPPHAVFGDKLQERGRPEERSEQRFALTVREDGIGRLLPPL
jgi:hypothetical protein